jgi:pyrroloquinoline quinone biosynthesis protein B
VSADGAHWVLLNASPDLRSQVASTRTLHPREGVRHSPIAAVVLTGAEIDQIAGLINLRERQKFALYGTPECLAAVAVNPMFDALAPDVVTRHAVTPGALFAPAPGLTAELFTVPGKVPLYLERGEPAVGDETGATVGVEIAGGNARLAFVPGAAAMTPALHARLKHADAVLFDGTLFTDDEMIRTGTGVKTGRRMGHMPIDGDGGSLAALAGLSGRRIYIHVNNTNPIHVARSPERRKVEAAGWEVAADGMEIVL